MPIDTRDLADDLEEIASAIPRAPAGLGILRQQLALLPNPLAAQLQSSLPTEEMSAPAEAADTMAGEGPGTISGAAIIGGSVGTGQIAPGAITAPKMATDVKPIAVVAALPALPNAAYPVNTWVYVTGDKKLYKNVADVWTYVINDQDITANMVAANTLTAGQIAAGAIGTSELLVGAVLTGGIVNDNGAGAALGSVVINSSGITIINGALAIQDQFGTSVMTGAGFGGSWLDFLSRGNIYNGAFLSGDTVDIAVTEVAGGTPTANYNASLTSHLPYWVVGTSDGTLKIVADSTAAGGLAIQSTASVNGQVNRWYQDIPWRPFSGVGIVLSERWTLGGNQIVIKVYTSYRAADHSIIGSRFLLDTATRTVTQGSYTKRAVYQTAVFGGQAPASTAYLRVEIEVTHMTAAGTTYWLSDLVVEPDHNAALVGADGVVANSYLALVGSGNYWDTDGAIINGARILGAGTAFPSGGPGGTSVANGDLFYRTDLEMWFAYSGTAWLTETLFTAHGTALAMTGTTGAQWLQTALNYDAPNAGGDIYIEDVNFIDRVITTNDASNYWTVTLYKATAGGATVSLGTKTTSVDAVNNWVAHQIPVNALITAATYTWLLANVAKTGAPGNIEAWGFVTYRLMFT